MLIRILSFFIFFNGAIFCEDFRSTQPDFNVPSVHQLTTPYQNPTSPFWDNRKQILYFVDPQLKKLLSYNYKCKAVNSIDVDGAVSSVIPAKNNEKLLYLSVDNSIAAVDWDGEHAVDSKTMFLKLTDQFTNNNSTIVTGKADKHGRIWVATKYSNDCNNNNINTNSVESKEGSLFTVTKSDLSHPHAKSFPGKTTDSFVWNAANDKIYFVDSESKKVIENNYNDEAGTIVGNKTVFEITPETDLGGTPDGIAMDAEDNLWIALNGGGSVVKVNPRDGKVLQVVALPASDVTAVTWGGPNLGVLFATTSCQKFDREKRRTQPAAGSVFAITGTGSRGLPEYLGDIFDGPVQKIIEQRRVVFDFNQYAANHKYDHQKLEIDTNFLQQPPLIQLFSSTPQSTRSANNPKIFAPLNILNSNFLQKRTHEPGVIQDNNPIWSTLLQAAQNVKNFFVKSK